MQWASPDMANKAKARLRDPALSRNLAVAYFKMSVSELGQESFHNLAHHFL